MHPDSALIMTAYRELFHETLPYRPILSYSAKFRGYNANARLWHGVMQFHLSRQWESVHEDIKIGLLQSLLVRLFKKRARTMNMDLYESFLKKVHIAVEKTRSDPLLERLFNELNGAYFNGLLELPNLAWNASSNRLGVYEYSTDTISITTLLKENEHLLKYVLYHEMLHKKHKFSGGTLRHRHHTFAFKQQEQAYPHAEQLENELSRFVFRKKRFFGFF